MFDFVQGATAGLVVGLLLTFWFGIGASIYKPAVPMPPVSVEGCPPDPTMNITNTTQLPVNLTFTEIKVMFNTTIEGQVMLNTTTTDIPSSSDTTTRYA